MGKWIKKLILSVMAAILATVALTGPVFADPVTPNTPDESTTTTVTNPGDQTATPTDQTDDAATPAEGEPQSCYDQIGSLGWLVCPGTGLLSRIIDDAYSLLSYVIKVNPIPTDHDSPFYIVWEYFKNITNLVFVVFLLVIIFSQLTGVGINNYGIKKTLPRIIIAAILVNLSYYICIIAVDISNILGNSLQGFFENVQNVAIQNGTISGAAAEASVAAITYAILGIGAATVTIGAVAFAGGIGGLFWMLAPTLLAGVIAILTALAIMAARQALIYLLVMVSPLALVAYMLPNTESWFNKWYKLFARMLIFYPMFSVLFGASQLAGLAIIATATNAFTVILGIGVKIVPLFMAIPMMRMSGTVLDKLNGISNRLSAPLAGGLAGYAASQQALKKREQLAKQNPKAPSTRLAQFLERRRARREYDAAELAEVNKQNNLRYAEDTMYSGKGKNRYLNKRGLRHYANEERKLENDNAHKQFVADFDEGFANNDKRIRSKDRGEIAALNRRYDDAIVEGHIAKARQVNVTLANDRRRAERIHDALDERGNSNSPENIRIRQQIRESFHFDNRALNAALAKEERRRNGENVTFTDAEQNLLRDHKRSLNVVLADAIAVKRKADATDKSTYLELYDDSPAGPSNEHKLVEAIDTDDYNSMSAAIEIMAKRGDYQDIQRVLRDNSHKLVGEEHLYTQKVLNDTLIRMKQDDPYLWAYAKNNMIRRSINTSKGVNTDGENGTSGLEAFVDFKTFLTNRRQAGDGSEDYDKVSFSHILEGLKDGKLFSSADRTSFKGVLKAIQTGTVPVDDQGHAKILVEPVKFARASLCSGNMDGEALDSYNKLFTLGYKGATQEAYHEFRGTEAGIVFERYKSQVNSNLEEFFRDMSVSQLASTKTATLFQFNDAMNAIDDFADGSYENVDIGTPGNPKIVKLNNRLRTLLGDKIADLNRNNMAGTRSNMNPAVRQLLGINGREEN